MSEHYKRHIIDPRAYELADGTGWSAQLAIYREHGSYGTDTMFYLQQTYGSREEALNAALAAGRRKVDEGYDDSNAVNDPPAVPHELSGA
jgi:hypothetical protein